MIKKTAFVIIGLMLVFSLSAFAGEGSDTVGGGKLLPQLRYGYSDMEWGTHSLDAGEYRTWDIDTHDYYAQLNWGILNNVDLIALIGGRSMRMESDYTAAGPEYWNQKSDRFPALLWGLGFRATFFRADNGFYMGGGALFTYTLANDIDFTEYEDGVVVNEFDADLRAYTITPELHVGYHFKNIGLTPYLGVDYVISRAVIETDWDGQIESHVNDPVFMFVGLDHYITDRLYLNVEGRTNFSGGWGIEGGLGYMFDLCAKPVAPAPAPAPVIEPKLEPMSKN